MNEKIESEALENFVDVFWNVFDADPIKCPDFMDIVKSSSPEFQRKFWGMCDQVAHDIGEVAYANWLDSRK